MEFGSLEEILCQGHNWRNIQQIVKLCFDKFSVICKQQQAAIQELQYQLDNKVTVSEMYSLLSEKADIRNVQDQMASLKQMFDGKSRYGEILMQLEEKADKAEFLYEVQRRPTIEDMNQALAEKVSISYMGKEIQEVWDGVESVKDNVEYQINRLDQSTQGLEHSMRNKVNYETLQEIEEQIEALRQNAASVAQVETLCQSKAEYSDIKRLLIAIDGKADKEQVNLLEKVIDNKVEVKDFYQKADRQLVEDMIQQTSERIHQLSLKIQHEIEYYQNIQNENKNEFNLQLDGLQQQLQSKADGKDLGKAVAVLHKKADMERVNYMIEQVKSEVQDMYKNVHSSQDDLRTDIQERFNAFYDQNQKFKSEQQMQIQNMKELTKQQQDNWNNENLYVKKMINEVQDVCSKDLSKGYKEIQEKLDKLEQEIDMLQQSKVDQQEFGAHCSDFNRKLGQKAEKQDFEQNKGDTQQHIQKQIIELREAYNHKLLKFQDTIQDQLDNKVPFTQFQEKLLEKADLSNVQKLLNTRAPQESVDYLQELMRKINQENQQKLSRKELDQHINFTKLALDEIAKDMIQKANITDIFDELDKKANIVDVNQLLTSTHQELDQKASFEDLTSYINDQALIIEALCAETTVARWLWKTGDLKAGHTIPWEVQVINTSPDNFIWERDTTGILVVNKGLYEITFGFYSRKKPMIQLLVNGEAVLSGMNNSSYVLHHSSGKVKQIAGHSAGNVTGLTMIDYLALPARARISLCYTGESRGEGFFGIRKL